MENNLGSFQVKSYDKEIINKDEVIIEVKKEALNYFDKNQNLITKNQKAEKLEVTNHSKERGVELERSNQEKTTNSKTFSSN